MIRCYTNPYQSIVRGLKTVRKPRNNRNAPIKQPSSGKSRSAVVTQAFTLALWAAVIVFCWFNKDAITLDGILRITPRNIVPAAFLMLGLFALKSVSVVMYCGILYAASGILFSLPLAIAVNLLGTCVMSAVPYFLGKSMGLTFIDRIESRNKNAALLSRFRRENTWHYAFLIRIINLLPYDVVSAYFGATKTAFLPYLFGSVLGMIGPCVLFPILGMNITDPTSPQFMIAAAIELAIMAVSGVSVFAARRKVSAKKVG